ncbi:anti-sigma regulatory factor (Ser/Thr protein kinase) [Thermobifida halotolerans]|nr:ATP-binding protein [Thermobifida halotolerans]
MGADVLVRWAAPDERNVGEARYRLRRILPELGVAPEQVEDAELMVSELVTNAVRHGGAPVGVLVWECRAAGCVVVEVHDAGEGWPLLPSPLEAADLDCERESGRGLPAVTAYSGGLCGVVRLERGKAAWFALPLARAAACAELAAKQIEVRNIQRGTLRPAPVDTSMPLPRTSGSARALAAVPV